LRCFFSPEPDPIGGTIDALPYVVLIIAVAVILMLGIDRLLGRLGIRPEDPASAGGGFRDVVDAARRWLRGRE
jgi:hypothetical protein